MDKDPNPPWAHSIQSLASEFLEDKPDPTRAIEENLNEYRRQGLTAEEILPRLSDSLFILLAIIATGNEITKNWDTDKVRETTSNAVELEILSTQSTLNRMEKPSDGLAEELKVLKAFRRKLNQREALRSTAKEALPCVI